MMIYTTRFDSIPAHTYNATILLIFLAISICLSIACLIASIIAFLPAKNKVKQHEQNKEKYDSHSFIKRVDEIEKLFTAHNISQEEAFHRLASLAREYATIRLHHNVRSQTLADLTVLHTTGFTNHKNNDGVNLLRATIESLYPPEFASAQTLALAPTVTVHDGCRWITALITRWEE